LDEVQVGNAYVNRGITGAIVQRQPFGGWKASSVGLGSKAGGPNYVMLFGTWRDAPHDAVSTPLRSSIPAVASLVEAVETKQLLGDSDFDWLKRAVADDALHWKDEFGAAKDLTGLHAEANIFRYLPEHVLLRVSHDAEPQHVLRAAAAAATAGARVNLSVDPKVSKATKKAVSALSALTGSKSKDSNETFATKLAEGRYDAPEGGIRVRVIGTLAQSVRETVAHRPEVALLNDPVTASGRVELRYWVKEQSISMTLHRFGNPSKAFGDLADQLKR
jgi:RHH-type transcriptional regulator, proline utilization regulon repressor / proline dehydrogenase / delta 1-pyrroline-5-carboxylate dehydrogenase